VAGVEGLEPPTLGLEIRCSILLSYTPTIGESRRDESILSLFIGSRLFADAYAAANFDERFRTAVVRLRAKGKKQLPIAAALA
jgi:hypothetical protein